MKFILLDTIKMQRRWSRDLGTQHLSVSSLEKKTELKRIFSELQIAINYIVILTFSTFWSYSLFIVPWIVLSSFPCITIIQLIIIFSFFCSCSHLTQLFSFNCFQMSVYFFKPFLVILLILSSSHSPIGQVYQFPLQTSLQPCQHTSNCFWKHQLHRHVNNSAFEYTVFNQQHWQFVTNIEARMAAMKYISHSPLRSRQMAVLTTEY